jgi:prolyl 4-hydroxylase
VPSERTTQIDRKRNVSNDVFIDRATSQAQAHGQSAGTERSPQEQLYQWIAERRGEDYCAAQIFNAIQSSGWSREAAAAAMQHVMGDVVTQREIDALICGFPWPDLSQSSSVITVHGHEVQVLMDMRNPRIVLFGNLLTDEECDQFIRLAEPRMQRSKASRDGVSKPDAVHEGRTSYSANLWRGEHEVVNRVDERVHALLNWPVEFSEDWQVMRYDKGAQFVPHFDCFSPDVGPWHPWLRRGGHRCGTLLIYLKTPQRGGSTAFPDVPMDVRAHKGSAVYFAYPRSDSLARTKHAGAPVMEGEKWAVVKWFRQGPHH